MILVKRLDLDTGTAVLEMRSADVARGEERVASLADAARVLGVRVVSLQTASGERLLVAAGAPDAKGTVAVPDAAAGAIAPAHPGLVHAAAWHGNGVRYCGGFPHELPSCHQIQAYTEFVLRAAGVAPRDMGLVRLVAYELCVNAVEHGRTARSPATIEVGFEVTRSNLRGWVRDQCAPFDPLVFPSTAVARLVDERRVRGYGLQMVRRVVDSLQHTHDGQGNMVSFTKELMHERN